MFPFKNSLFPHLSFPGVKIQGYRILAVSGLSQGSECLHKNTRNIRQVVSVKVVASERLRVWWPSLLWRRDRIRAAEVMISGTSGTRGLGGIRYCHGVTGGPEWYFVYAQCT